MFAHERHKALLSLLERRRRMTNQALTRALHVSEATLRRDLADLETGHQVVRFHGGAAHPQYLRSESTLEQRSHQAIAAKRAMAVAAAQLVPPQQTVFIDAGTSCLEVGRALMVRGDLTIIANSVAFLEMARDASARIMCLGGELRGVTSALVGALALSWLSQLRAGWAFIGATGLSEEGPSTTELSETGIKQALIERSTNRVLVADAGKWDRPAAVRFAAWPNFNTWITSGTLPASAVARIGKLGPRVVRAVNKERKAS